MAAEDGGGGRCRVAAAEGDGGVVSDVITYQNSVRRGKQRYS